MLTAPVILHVPNGTLSKPVVPDVGALITRFVYFNAITSISKEPPNWGITADTFTFITSVLS